jgi:multimeric flavodoxin WrbA
MISVINGSSRNNGNSKALENLLFKGIEYTSVDLKDYKIEPIEDLRHDVNGFNKKEDDYYKILEIILKSDQIVFITPIYWYTMSGHMKALIDRFSESLRDESIDFKASMASKKVYLIAVGGDNPKEKGLPLVQQFKYISEFISWSFEGHILAEGNKPMEVLDDYEAINEVKMMNEKILES